MLVCCWSAKGGAGTTVVAVALASMLARAAVDGVLLVDLAGDARAVAGLPDGATDVGVADWLREGPAVPADGLARLESHVNGRLALLSRGAGPLRVDRAHALVSHLSVDSRTVVVDAGVVAHDGVAAIVAAAASESLLVTRACFLSLRRAMVAPVRPSGVVLLVEEGRALVAADVESALGTPVRAEVSVTAQVARAVDAGVLVFRLPRSLERELRHAV